MSNPKKALDLYKEKLAESKIDPLNVHPNVRAGTEAIVRNAARELPDLARRYKDEVIGSTVIIAVQGEGSQEFANIAKYKFKTVSVDYYHVLDRMVKSMRKRGVRDSYHNQEYSMTLDEFGQLRQDYDIIQLPPPRINHTVDPVYNQTLEVALKNLIEINYGNQLYSVVVRREIGNQALEHEFSGKTLAAVVYNYPGNLDESLLPKPFMVIDANRKVDEKFVSAKLAEVRSKLNPKPTKKPSEQNQETEEKSIELNQGE